MTRRSRRTALPAAVTAVADDPVLVFARQLDGACAAHDRAAARDDDRGSAETWAIVEALQDMIAVTPSKTLPGAVVEIAMALADLDLLESYEGVFDDPEDRRMVAGIVRMLRGAFVTTIAAAGVTPEELGIGHHVAPDLARAGAARLEGGAS